MQQRPPYLARLIILPIPCQQGPVINDYEKWIRYHQVQSWGKYSEDEILNVFIQGEKKKMVLISEIAILNWSLSYKPMVTAKASCAQHYSRQTQQWCTARWLVRPGHSYAMLPFSWCNHTHPGVETKCSKAKIREQNNCWPASFLASVTPADLRYPWAPLF